MTNPAEFLKLIGAPWGAYHDHPDEKTAKDRASIRPVDREYHEVCGVYLCDYPGDPGKAARACRDLIVQAPRMYQYIASMAATGDTEAKLILREIHGEQA